MLDLHGILRDLHLMGIKLSVSHGQAFWIPVALLVCSVIFLIVGLSRVVEITALKLTPLRTAVLNTAHVIGCILFSLAMALLGMDVMQTHTPVIAGFLFSALAILLPLHIYVALLRRVRLQGSSKAEAP